MPSPLLRWLVVLSLSSGCDQSSIIRPTEPTAAALRALSEGPPQAAELLNRTADPIEQQQLLWAMVERDVARTQQACAHLTERRLQGSCDHLTARPHLIQPPTPSASQPFQADAAHPLADTDDTCGDRPGAELCRIEQAERLAQSTAIAEAGGLCHRISAPLWRAECHFRTADTLLMRNPRGDYATAAAFCLDAGALVERCQERLLEGLARSAPPASTPPAGWASFQRRLASAQAFWQDHTPAAAVAATEHVLAVAVVTALQQATAGGQQLAEALGPDATPHLRAALAADLVRDTPGTDASLDALAAQVLARAAAPATERAARPGAPMPVLGVRDLWVLPADAEPPPSTRYLSGSRRAVSDDPPSDAAIAVLEAAARWHSAPDRLLAEGQQHADPAVRWTAQRLRSRDQHGPRPVSLAKPSAPPIR